VHRRVCRIENPARDFEGTATLTLVARPSADETPGHSIQAPSIPTYAVWLCHRFNVSHRDIETADVLIPTAEVVYNLIHRAAMVGGRQTRRLSPVANFIGFNMQFKR
jgi:hypothetical protein